MSRTGKILQIFGIVMGLESLILSILDVMVAHSPYLVLLNLITLGSGLIAWRMGKMISTNDQKVRYNRP